MNIFKSLKILLALGEKMYSLRNGAPLKERNKIKFHRSLRGEGGCNAKVDLKEVSGDQLWFELLLEMFLELFQLMH